MSTRAALARMAVVVVCAALLAACGSVADGGGNGLSQTKPADARGKVAVVASTNVWGDIAAQIGGDAASVTSVIDNASTDPHEYEADVNDAAVVAHARVILENGLGYDEFLTRLVAAGHRSDATVVDVAELVGAKGDVNPHLWYSPDYVRTAARAIEAALSAADPAHAAMFRANLTAFLADEQSVVDVIDRIKARYSGTAVGYTERVPGYLVEAAGLSLGTPSGFSKALEQGTDPSPLDASKFEKALKGHAVKALLYNAQVTDPTTARLRALAEDNGVPVVGVTETKPSGKNFQTWQRDQAAALLAALGG